MIVTTTNLVACPRARVQHIIDNFWSFRSLFPSENTCQTITVQPRFELVQAHSTCCFYVRILDRRLKIITHFALFHELKAVRGNYLESNDFVLCCVVLCCVVLCCVVLCCVVLCCVVLCCVVLCCVVLCRVASCRRVVLLNG